MYFNICIRTLLKLHDIYEYGVGGGIVWDSNIKDETPNQIIDFLQRHPSIETIIFNGQNMQTKMRLPCSLFAIHHVKFSMQSTLKQEGLFYTIVPLSQLF